MKVDSFTALESQVLSLINQKIDTYEKLLENVSFGERLLTQTLEGLITKNLIVFDTKTKVYHWDTPQDKEIVILDGNIMLPTTVIKIPEKGIMYVCRGSWYQFPIDFDIRRIIWNVKLLGKNNSTLVELIRTSVLKQRKSKIVHISTYDNIRNKSVPYAKDFVLYLKSVGEEVTDADIQFRIALDPSDTFSSVHRGFSVNTEISTKELIDELKKPINERNYAKNILLNHIYNFSDFIFKDNEIPISFIDNKYNYVKIVSTGGATKKSVMELAYYQLDLSGVSKKIDTELYEDINEGYAKLRDLFSGYASVLLNNNDFICELTN